MFINKKYAFLANAVSTSQFKGSHPKAKANKKHTRAFQFSSIHTPKKVVFPLIYWMIFGPKYTKDMPWSWLSGFKSRVT